MVCGLFRGAVFTLLLLERFFHFFDLYSGLEKKIRKKNKCSCLVFQRIYSCSKGLVHSCLVAGLVQAILHALKSKSCFVQHRAVIRFGFADRFRETVRGLVLCSPQMALRPRFGASLHRVH